MNQSLNRQFSSMSLDSFHPIIAQWFRNRFGSPTDVQTASWPAITSGAHALIAAPTGSGKTLAAFLCCIDTLLKQALAGELTDQTQVVYVSPLKALSNDVQKNLRQPLAEIAELVMANGLLIPEIRVEVRTGDTPTPKRQQLLRRPPHILITTPESLFLLLTAHKSRGILQNVHTVIVDEIHALASNKRGAHLALSLERLAALTQTTLTRIGLSATQRPIDDIACFLVGQRASQGQAQRKGLNCHIVDMGQRRTMDLAVEVPKDELGAVATNAVWADIYDRLAELANEHRSTLIFVNTRRLAERVSHYLADRLGHDLVAAHHGSLSRSIRLSAEERLKQGRTRVVVATASLELGIDIGTVDLVCHIGSPRAIATCLQRVGRSGHWVGAIPRGRLFPTTRDELIECAAVIRAIRLGQLDRITIPPEPLDILAQQIVAAIATQEWHEDELYNLCTRAHPYRDLRRQDFDALIHMLAEGYTPGRGRRQAYIFYDRVHRQLRARRGARLAALTNGGAIPDTATYAVVAEPEGTIVGSVDEDFAVESQAGDIILLGNTSWRIRGVETGAMRVEDAHGAPPTVPFWRGEAPSRTAELSAEVAAIRKELSHLLEQEQSLNSADHPTSPPSSDSPALAWLQSECGLDSRTAGQALAYIAAGHHVLGAVPTQETIIAERFFDEAGGMQLVIHAPFGGRLNRAWGLALRKRFCVTFDFELQAAATDEGLVISLGEKHSFPLDAIFTMLRSTNVRDALVQAVLAAPMFIVRWRWNVSRSLALLRFQKGRRVPLHIQRMRAEDLLTAVFPRATACQDNRHGDIPVPDHPLIQETMRDCLSEAMDLTGLTTLLQRMEQGQIRCLAVESPAPSPFSHEILNANPYAFLDDAPLEERRARAVDMRRMLSPDQLGELGSLDPAAIDAVFEEAWPMVREPDELQEVLHTLIWVPEEQAPGWAQYLPILLETGRTLMATLPPSADAHPADRRGWVAREHLSLVHAVFPDAVFASQHDNEPPLLDENQNETPYEDALFAIVQGWMDSIGPITARELAAKLHCPPRAVHATLLQLEAQGHVLRGQFRPTVQPSLPSASSGSSPQQEKEGDEPEYVTQEWCDRRLLARIHRRTVISLRREIEPVSAADFMRFLFRWQHVAPGTQLHGEPGLLEVIRQLAGFEAAASSWEPHILKKRLSNYSPDYLDYLCLRGTVTWGRLTPPVREENHLAHHRRRIIPTSLAPISLFPREEANWLFAMTRKDAKTHELSVFRTLSSVAHELHQYLHERGASFFDDITKGTGHLQAEVENGLWELAAAGLVTADGFDNLRALLDPRRRRAEGKRRARRPRHSIGRWSLLVTHGDRADVTAMTERFARQLLDRYGVVFRDLLKRESLPLAWRELVLHYRRLELRGEIRGGRFVNGFTGEQFALPEAVEALRAVRRDPLAGAQEIQLSASDPLNLIGIILPGARVPASPSNVVGFHNGVPIDMGEKASASA